MYRDIVGADHETGGVFVGSTMALREGSRVQLHVRDAAWGKARVKALLAGISDTDSSETGSGPPAGAVMYTCVSGNRMHAGDFREAVAACPLGGGFVAGEIAPAERGARARRFSRTRPSSPCSGSVRAITSVETKKTKKKALGVCVSSLLRQALW